MFRKSVNLLIIMLALATLSGCADSGKSSKYHKVISDKPRKSTFGFSVSPPDGENWFEGLKDKSLIFRKKIQNPNYSIITRATELRLDKTLASTANLSENVRQKKTSALEAKEVANTRFFVDKDVYMANCVRYALSYDDLSQPKTSATARYIRVQDKGLVCYHPQKPENGIEVSYLEQSLASARPNSYEHEGESFIKSLQIDPLVR